ncbi:MAG TPA: transglutaminase family protein [Steroidobacteraceae bacterium]|nr:transglutaminase family protein [Steroidobacteraceae bacterium]
MRYHIRHRTLYRYSADVVHSHQLLHLVPRPAPFQQCLEYALQITPTPRERRDEVDVFGNPMTSIELEHPHRELCVVAEMDVQVHTRPVVLAGDSWAWEQVREALSYHACSPPGREHLEACVFRHESAYVRIKRAFMDYASDCFVSGSPILAAADALSSKLHRDFQYSPGETTISTPLLEVLEQRRGVCQDFAHVMIACLRSLGLAARYVSGYVHRSGGADDASHAWIAVYAPPFGWVELDPTNDTRVATDHVAVAWGRDFGDVSPLRGVILGGGTHELSVSVAVAPLEAAQ